MLTPFDRLSKDGKARRRFLNLDRVNRVAVVVSVASVCTSKHPWQIDVVFTNSTKEIKQKIRRKTRHGNRER